MDQRDNGILQMYVSHEGEKKRKYTPRTIEVKKVSLTGAVFST